MNCNVTYENHFSFSSESIKAISWPTYSITQSPKDNWFINEMREIFFALELLPETTLSSEISEVNFIDFFWFDPSLVGCYLFNF